MSVSLEFVAGIIDDEDASCTARQKGYCDWAMARLDDGTCFRVSFTTVDDIAYSMARLRQSGDAVIAESGLIIVDHLFASTMRTAVQRAYDMRFFDGLKPMTDDEIEAFRTPFK